MEGRHSHQCWKTNEGRQRETTVRAIRRQMTGTKGESNSKLFAEKIAKAWSCHTNMNFYLLIISSFSESPYPFFCIGACPHLVANHSSGVAWIHSSEVNHFSQLSSRISKGFCAKLLASCLRLQPSKLAKPKDLNLLPGSVGVAAEDHATVKWSPPWRIQTFEMGEGWKGNTNALDEWDEIRQSLTRWLALPKERTSGSGRWKPKWKRDPGPQRLRYKHHF